MIAPHHLGTTKDTDSTLAGPDKFPSNKVITTLLSSLNVYVYMAAKVNLSNEVTVVLVQNLG